jgi:hypothetical protein
LITVGETNSIAALEVLEELRLPLSFFNGGASYDSPPFAGLMEIFSMNSGLPLFFDKWASELEAAVDEDFIVLQLLLNTGIASKSNKYRIKKILILG